MLRICRDNLQKERQEKARKEREKSKELKSLYTRTENIYGLWKTEGAVDEELIKLTTGQWGDQKLKLDALKTQISFRKKNLRQPFPAKLGAFSQAGRAYSVVEMTQKLKDIIKLAKKDKEREESQSASVLWQTNSPNSSN